MRGCIDGKGYCVRKEPQQSSTYASGHKMRDVWAWWMLNKGIGWTRNTTGITDSQMNWARPNKGDDNKTGCSRTGAAGSIGA